VHDALRVDVGQRTRHLVRRQRHAAQVCASLRGLAAGAEPALDHGILQAHNAHAHLVISKQGRKEMSTAVNRSILQAHKHTMYEHS
jgi:hypothetical protein